MPAELSTEQGGSMWKSIFLDKLSEYDFLSGVYVSRDRSQGDSGFWEKSIFAQRASVPYTTTWCEQSLGQDILKKALESSEVGLDSIVMDVGCGDGRYVRYLLDHGYKRIVALNYELEPLVSLRQGLSEDESERVLLICADVMSHPLGYETADFILAWALFSSVPDFKAALDICIDILKPERYIFNAEPVLEHALVYSLVMGDHEEFLRCLNTKTRPIMWSAKDSRYRVFSMVELEDLMLNSRVEIVDRDGINVIPSLLFGGVLANSDSLSEKEILWDALKDLKFGWNRQVTYLSRKIVG